MYLPPDQLHCFAGPAANHLLPRLGIHELSVANYQQNGLVIIELPSARRWWWFWPLPSSGPLFKGHDTTKFQFSLHRRASVPGSHSSSTNPSPSSVDAAQGDDVPTCRGPSGKVQWCWHLDGACHRTSVADSMHACVHVCTLLFMDIESALLYICHWFKHACHAQRQNNGGEGSPKGLIDV